MAVITIHPLNDGPISLDAVRTARASQVARMAKIVIDWGCWADADDCRLVLHHAGFNWAEIEYLLPDVRQVAVQFAVEMALGES